MDNGMKRTPEYERHLIAVQAEDVCNHLYQAQLGLDGGGVTRAEAAARLSAVLTVAQQEFAEREYRVIASPAGTRQTDISRDAIDVMMVTATERLEWVLERAACGDEDIAGLRRDARLGILTAAQLAVAILHSASWNPGGTDQGGYGAN
jgi:hypothetical protein